MLTRTSNRRGKIMLLSAAMTMGCLAPIVSPALAQDSTKPKHSFIHRHATATGAVAGVAAYKLAKHSKHGFAHRHPYMTGAAAAIAAHHYAKKKQ